MERVLPDLRPRSAAELLQLALGGDREALENLLMSYQGYLKVLSRAHLDKRIQHRVSPADLVQDTLLEAHRDFHKFHGTTTAEFTGWIRQVLVHNHARAIETHLLAAKRDVRREQVAANLSGLMDQSHQRLSALLSDHRRSPPSEADHQESLARMAIAIERLPADYAEVITLRHIEGLRFGTVAQRMGRSPGAARMLWLRAIEGLREAMGQQP